MLYAFPVTWPRLLTAMAALAFPPSVPISMIWPCFQTAASISGKLASGSIRPFSQAPTTTSRSLIQVGWQLLFALLSTPKSVRTPSRHTPAWLTKTILKAIWVKGIGSSRVPLHDGGASRIDAHLRARNETGRTAEGAKVDQLVLMVLVFVVWRWIVLRCPADRHFRAGSGRLIWRVHGLAGKDPLERDRFIGKTIQSIHARCAVGAQLRPSVVGLAIDLELESKIAMLDGNPIAITMGVEPTVRDWLNVIQQIITAIETLVGIDLYCRSAVPKPSCRPRFLLVGLVGRKAYPTEQTRGDKKTMSVMSGK